MSKVKKYVEEALKYEIFDEVEDVAGDAFGVFTIANPFIDEADYQNWLKSQTSLPAWLKPCPNLNMFHGRAMELATAIDLLAKEGVLANVIAEYRICRSQKDSK